MIIASASAPGKVILFGEHAVVYGQPALAVPLSDVRAYATVRPGPARDRLAIVAANLARTLVVRSEAAPDEHALVIAVRLLMTELDSPIPGFQIVLNSTIPIASGLGSGAASTTAVLRALSAALERPLVPAALNELVFEIEKLHHGTPSGIDNTVIVYEQPVFFVRGQPIATFAVGGRVDLLVADTGIASPTHLAVGDVRRLYETEPHRVLPLIERIGGVAIAAREALAVGDGAALGSLARENHELLRNLTVSSPELDRLVEVAEAAGAYGAKLSGGGRGAGHPNQSIVWEGVCWYLSSWGDR
jgi:mevalonate kinase